MQREGRDALPYGAIRTGSGYQSTIFTLHSSLSAFRSPPPPILPVFRAFPGLLGWLAAVPTQVYQALPFIITAIVLFGTSIRNKRGSGLPAALGLNYFREER